MQIIHHLLKYKTKAKDDDNSLTVLFFMWKLRSVFLKAINWATYYSFYLSHEMRRWMSFCVRRVSKRKTHGSLRNVLTAAIICMFAQLTEDHVKTIVARPLFLRACFCFVTRKVYWISPMYFLLSIFSNPPLCL